MMTMAPAPGSDCASLLSDAQSEPCAGAMGFVYTDKYKSPEVPAEGLYDDHGSCTGFQLCITSK